jgi:hypothetical protein
MTDKLIDVVVFGASLAFVLVVVAYWVGWI